MASDLAHQQLNSSEQDALVAVFDMLWLLFLHPHTCHCTVRLVPLSVDHPP